MVAAMIAVFDQHRHPQLGADDRHRARRVPDVYCRQIGGLLNRPSAYSSR
jgi:hypothetical protein